MLKLRAPSAVKLTLTEVFWLIRPYVSVRFMEQFKAVVPLALYLALFQLLILRQTVEESALIVGCCGIGPDHIRLLKQELPARVPGRSP